VDRLENLAGVENIVWIEQVFDLAHEVERDRVFTLGSRSRFMTPTPCSAEIEPPNFFTTAKTAVFTSFQRARNSARSAPTGWLTL
jgi:hypothetical protein